MPALALTLLLTSVPAIQSHVLANGLEVLVVENHALPLVTVELAGRNGSMTEPPEYNGLSHLYEHMFFKANAVIPSQEAYFARLRELGIVFNATTETERVNYYFTTTQDHLDEALAFMRDAATSPTFEPGELQKERRVVTGEMDRDEADPGYHLFKATSDKLWWKYPSRKDPLGNRQTVLGLPPALVHTPDDKLPPETVKKAVALIRRKMETIEKRYYVPNNSVLVITGDVKADQVFARVDALFHGWKRAEDPFKNHPLVHHPPLKRTDFVLVEQPVETFSAIVAWTGPSSVGQEVPLTYPADLLAFALDPPTSRFQKALIDSGACVAAGFHWETARNVGPIYLNVEAEPQKADACLKAALAELPKMKDPGYVSDAELANAVHSAEMQQAHEREAPSGLANALTFWWASAGLDYYRSYVESLRKVKREDIARFMNTYVIGKPFVLGVMISPEMKEKLRLDEAHFGEVVAQGGRP